MGRPQKKKRLTGAESEEDCQATSSPELHLPPELLEMIFSYFETGPLLEIRKVSKSWNDEICRILGCGLRTKFAQCREDMNGFGTRGNYIRRYPGRGFANQVIQLKSILRTTNNSKLFSTFIIPKFKSLLHSPYLLSPYGDILTRLTIAVNDIMEHLRSKPSIALGILHEILWKWCPNLRFLQLSSNWYDYDETALPIDETFESSSTDSLGIQELELKGRFMRIYPNFSINLMKRCPDLTILRFPSHCGWQNDDEATKFAETLAALPKKVTGQLTEFQISGSPWRRIPSAFADVQFGQLKKLEIVDAPITPIHDYDLSKRKGIMKLPLHRILEKVQFTLTDLVIHLDDWSITVDPGATYLKTLDISIALAKLKKLVIFSGKSHKLSLYRVLRMTPQLEVLVLFGSSVDDDETGLSKSVDWYFPPERTPAANPHKKLVNYHPVGSMEELKGVLESFPNVEHLGLHFKSYKASDKTGVVKLHEAFGPVGAIPRLRTLDVWTEGYSPPKQDWTKALDQLDFFPCLQKLLIHTEDMLESAMKKVKQCVDVLPSPPCPILFIDKDDMEYEFLKF